MAKGLILAIVLILVLCAATMFGLGFLFNNSLNSQPESKTPDGSKLVAANVHAHVFSRDRDTVYYFQIESGKLNVIEYNATNGNSSEIAQIDGIYSLSDSVVVTDNDEMVFMGRTDKNNFDRYDLFKVSSSGTVNRFEIHDSYLATMSTLEIEQANFREGYSDQEVNEICNQYDNDGSLEYDLNKIPHEIDSLFTAQSKFKVIVNEDLGKFIPKALCPDLITQKVENANSPMFMEKVTEDKVTTFNTSEWDSSLVFTANKAGLRNFDSSPDYNLVINYGDSQYDFGFSRFVDVISTDRHLFDSAGNMFVKISDGKQPPRLYVISINAN